MKEHVHDTIPFLGQEVSRRKFLWGLGGLGVGAIMLKNGEEIVDAAKIAYEYGPEVAKEVALHPGQSLEAYRLWKRPESSYLKSPSFYEDLLYRRDVPNNIVAFGDSNIVGPDGTDWRNSPIILFKDLAQKRLGVHHWNDFNCAKSGYTTDRVREEQVHSSRAREGFSANGKSDVWINVGGNDMSHLVENGNEVNELKRLADNPFSDMGLLFKYTSRIEDNICFFGKSFENLLQNINSTYDDEIRQYVIMSMPNFGDANSIRTQEIDGVEYVVSIKNSAARRLIKNISIRMNNEMFKVVDSFGQKAHQRMVGINTATPQISDFSSNQHFSFEACEAIALDAINRAKFANAA